tara:strand:- start:44 stop:307 length:264 start_codon:yes stop_codon:yes gene_type:complete
MTEKQMNYVADRVANTIIDFMLAEQTKFQNEYSSMHDIMNKSSEQTLMNELSACFTELDATLKLEDYDKCAEIQRRILTIEKQLKLL